jgi:hypothetical protein
MSAPQFTDELHRELGKQIYNGTWDLIDQADRTPEQDRLMLVSACASWWHWDKAGTEQNRATADWQVAHVASLLGYGDLALEFASSALERVEAGSMDDWMRASALEGLARAHAAAGHQAERDDAVRMAREALADISEEDERTLIASQIDTVPDADEP